MPRAPRPVPLTAALREHLLPLATGASWIIVGALSLIVARSEGMPPPEQATRGSGIAWLIGIGLLLAGAVLASWALVRGLWWSRLQRYGRAVDAVVVRARPVDWFRIAGRGPIALDLSYVDPAGTARACRLLASGTLRGNTIAEGDRVVLVHSLDHPERAAIYWDR